MCFVAAQLTMTHLPFRSLMFLFAGAAMMDKFFSFRSPTCTCEFVEVGSGSSYSNEWRGT